MMVRRLSPEIRRKRPPVEAKTPQILKNTPAVPKLSSEQASVSDGAPSVKTSGGSFEGCRIVIILITLSCCAASAIARGLRLREPPEILLHS